MGKRSRMKKISRRLRPLFRGYAEAVRTQASAMMPHAVVSPEPLPEGDDVIRGNRSSLTYDVDAPTPGNHVGIVLDKKDVDEMRRLRERLANPFRIEVPSTHGTILRA